ncbi:MAG: hypothetical protein IIT94_11110, partial [Prevotella sp.]|nr:hypothetical protein [Prevotella sp.]
MGRFATLLFFLLLGLTVNADTEPEIATNGVKYYLVQPGSYGALPFVDGDAVLVVQVTQHIVAWNGMAGIADDVMGDGFLVED